MIGKFTGAISFIVGVICFIVGVSSSYSSPFFIIIGGSCLLSGALLWEIGACSDYLSMLVKQNSNQSTTKSKELVPPSKEKIVENETMACPKCDYTLNKLATLCPKCKHSFQ